MCSCQALVGFFARGDAIVKFETAVDPALPEVYHGRGELM